MRSRRSSGGELSGWEAEPEVKERHTANSLALVPSQI